MFRVPPTLEKAISPLESVVPSVPDWMVKTPALEVSLVNVVETVFEVFETSSNVGSVPP
jgi:hypothetical protein